ncbi:UNVERIFIED_CONTAM: Non-structural maintenance of chromosomes element 4B [Sesamum radiatum]|uniref:Non-structural maintenance of chromosomes element 4 n=1 Tax=Sesamum radiatum TaxID=300843 RepID=A0AAW2W5Y6_SESRA
MESKLKREREMENEGFSVVKEEHKESTQENEPTSKRGKDEIACGDSEKFMAIMNEFENMHQHVLWVLLLSIPRGAGCRCRGFAGADQHFGGSVKTHTSGNVTPAEFVSCLIRDFGQKVIMKRSSENSPDVSWQNIGCLVSPIFMNVPGCRTMVGPMENKIKQQKLVGRVENYNWLNFPVRAEGKPRAGRRAQAERKARPEEVEKTAEVVSDTETNLFVMFEVLKKQKQVKVENLMLNRNSFAQTVENLFALSFLVKDGRVRIDVDETGSQVASTYS